MKWLFRSFPGGIFVHVWLNVTRLDWGAGHAGVFWAAGAKRENGGEDEEYQGDEVSGRHLQNRE